MIKVDRKRLVRIGIQRKHQWAEKVHTFYSYYWSFFFLIYQQPSIKKKQFFFRIDGEIVAQTNCNQTRLDVVNANCNMSVPSAASPERMIQSPSHGLVNGTLHNISQPYLGDSSNFGPFYHHHGQHPHIPSYGSPYDKYKSMHHAHARSPNTSPYDPYQSFYSSNPHHHHQIVRPNGYIDLVPR